MQLRNSQDSYGFIPQALHWAVVVLVILAWALGTFDDVFPKGPARAAALFVHISAGLAVIAFVAVRLLWRIGDPPPRPEKTPLFNSVVSYGNLVFIAGIGAHFEGDIKAHTAHVLDEMQKALERAGSSMEKVLKVNVYLNDLKDYAAMNEVFLGRFGPEPGVRTTVAPAGGIPGNSLVEIDCIACI